MINGKGILPFSAKRGWAGSSLVASSSISKLVQILVQPHGIQHGNEIKWLARAKKRKNDCPRSGYSFRKSMGLTR